MRVPSALPVPGAGAELQMQQRELQQELPGEQAEEQAEVPEQQEQQERAEEQVLREQAELQAGEPVFRMTCHNHRRNQLHRGFLFRN